MASPSMPQKIPSQSQYNETMTMTIPESLPERKREDDNCDCDCDCDCRCCCICYCILGICGAATGGSGDCDECCDDKKREDREEPYRY